MVPRYHLESPASLVDGLEVLVDTLTMDRARVCGPSLGLRDRAVLRSAPSRPCASSRTGGHERRGAIDPCRAGDGLERMLGDDLRLPPHRYRHQVLVVIAGTDALLRTSHRTTGRPRVTSNDRTWRTGNAHGMSVA
ncbi:hypothetical protein GCM10010251_25560 [Streptomyces aurantiogriseus]|uniref:Uncharacterized protein n=1 Tax=Streptomyces aurantiogriseus TaxID=66870 RepID=A0A918C6W6_9ACTN|nr:hypothetical protein GCM10010251_25560 [Streptomyces aurantiogriseus]